MNPAINHQRRKNMIRLFRFKKRHALLVLCFFNALISYADRTNISIAILPMTAEFGWKAGTKGFILSSFFYGYLCTQMIGGYLSFRYGGKKTLAISCALWSLFTFLTPLAAHSLHWLVACRIMLGLAEGVGFPSIMALISAHIPPAEHSRSIAFVLSGSYVGAILANLVSSMLIEMPGYGWQSTFYIFGLVGLVWLIPWSNYQAPTRMFPFELPVSSEDIQADLMAGSAFEKSKLKSSANSIEASNAMKKSFGLSDEFVAENEEENLTRHSNSRPALTDDDKPKYGLGEQAIPWRTIFQSREVWAIIIVQFCQSWSFWLLITWLPTYYENNFHVNIKEIGYFAVVPYMCQAIVGNVAGLLSDRMIDAGFAKLFVRKFMQASGMLLMSFFMMLAVTAAETIVQGMIYITLSMGLYCLTFAGVSVNHLDIAPNYAPIIYGIGNTAGQIPGILGVWLTGEILDATENNWFVVFGLASIISCFGAVCWILMAGTHVVIK